MKFTKLAMGIALAMAASTSFAANYIDVGVEENEITMDDAPGQNGDFYQTYVGFNFEPIEGSPFHIMGTMSNLQADASKNREGWNRLRRQLYVGYKWNFGNLTFAPMAGIRHHTYDHEAKRRDTEVRFFPGLNYKVSDTTDIFFGGYTSLIPTRNVDRSGETSDYKEYTDYKHELEVGVKQKLSWGDYFKVGVFNELDTFEDRIGAGKTEMDQWMIRLAYGSQVTDALFLEGIARFDVQRDNEYADGIVRDEKRNRYGVNFNYKLDQDWNIHGMAYYQTEDNKDRLTGADAQYTNEKFVYSLMVRRSF
ncbi:hypothetical protein [Endozoicomonas elysicola]|uniref:Outer membrane protein beta-barrel domain-containing protein n=1 Tax=Endozoicomonas elysicola TaxID=305900 RepID=A0A081KGM6_9GAMM|nr:hypothetical protein [Endozoicomonas elysicola]KEI73302.1 hypothetical protein GV64_23580 [Endozoicomonas elysicola]